MPAALALVLSIILGSTVTAGSALTTAQIVSLALIAAKHGPQAIAALRALDELVKTPAFREWAARNGEKAIMLQPGIITER